MKFTELYVNGEDRTAEMREIARIIGLDALGDRYSSLLHYRLALSYASRFCRLRVTFAGYESPDNDCRVTRILQNDNL